MDVQQYIKSQPLNKIARLTGISRANLRRLRDGAKPRPETLAKLRIACPYVEVPAAPLTEAQKREVLEFVIFNCECTEEGQAALERWLGLDAVD